MNKSDLFTQIQRKNSFLCVGLDTDPAKVPHFLRKENDPVFEFNKQIIEATAPFAVAYKPNLAFYESQGPRGLESLQKTLEWIPNDIFTIADAKRADIGNTSDMYARAFFETMQFDAITIAPYMGEDSVAPFLQYDGKWVILLALTSNKGSDDFQLLKVGGADRRLFEEVLRKSAEWGSEESMMYVVGATKAEKLMDIRKIVPNHFLLIPGIGAQGGDLEKVAKYGMTSDCGLLVNSSRSIIYASEDHDFAIKARAEAKKLQVQMERYLDQYCVGL
jgi:orotidine-5'-phosphate decarboxylase